MKPVLTLWYFWIIGMVIFPLIAILPQLNAIHQAIDDKGQNPEKIGKLFLTPRSLIFSVFGGMGTFICLILFFVSLILG
ncbi:MAG: hypothetical protein JW795_05445, partial [Chitinivibrionales bacterium]|nr:hypothetical protein [Chitinivibrionales bacterium]